MFIRESAYFPSKGDRFIAALPSVDAADKEKILRIERERLRSEQDLYVIAGQIYSLSIHPIDSWTLFRWMQANDIPSRYLIRRESNFYQHIVDNGLEKDVVALDTDCLHNELLEHTELLVRAKAFVVEWRTDSVADIWLQHLEGCRYVFLQHGIIGTCLTEVHRRVFSEEYNDINVSSEFEKQQVSSSDYVRKKCFVAGLPRYDLLQVKSRPVAATPQERVVFVMLTWRSHLNKDKETFFRSDYFKGLKNLFAPENVEKLKKKGVHFVYCAHHMLTDNIGEYGFDGIDVETSQEKVSYWIRHAQALVTDFSSTSFDFLFQDKPVVYWIPDKDDPALDHDDLQDGGKVDSAMRLRGGFPNTVDSVDEVMNLLAYYADRDFILEEEKKQKVEPYFDYKENFSQRVYENIEQRIREEKERNLTKYQLKRMSLPKVSIVIPAYNVEKYLSSCLESLIAQTYPDFEAIVVDDGSTDYTPQICEQYIHRDARIRVVTQENAGVSVARNRGIDEATGEYITFIDADDWAEPDYLETVVNAHPEADLLFFGNIHRHRDGTSHAYSPGNFIATEQRDREDVLYKMSKNDCWYEFFGYTWNKRFKSSIIRSHHLRFLPGLSLREDELFTEQYTRHIESLACTDRCVYNYRFSFGGLTYRFHPGLEVLALAKALDESTDGIVHHRLKEYKRSKVFHYLFSATLNMHTKESLDVFERLYQLYGAYRAILENRDNAFLDRRTRRRYHRIFAHSHWLSKLIFLYKRKKMKKHYHAV